MLIKKSWTRKLCDSPIQCQEPEPRARKVSTYGLVPTDDAGQADLVPVPQKMDITTSQHWKYLTWLPGTV